MTFEGFLRRLSFDQSGDEGAEKEPGSGILSGTTKLFDSVAAKKSDFVSDLSSKFGQLKRRASEEAMALIDKKGPEETARKDQTSEKESEGSIPAEGASKGSSAATEDTSQSARNVANTGPNGEAVVKQEVPSKPVKPRPPKPPPPRLTRQTTNPTSESSSSSKKDTPLGRHNSLNSNMAPRNTNYTPADADMERITQMECQKFVSAMGSLMKGSDVVPPERKPRAAPALPERRLSEDSAGYKDFIHTFVEKIFIGVEGTQDEKSTFGSYCQDHGCRVWFAKLLENRAKTQRVVPEEVFYRLVQYIAVVLFECTEAKDYVPAKVLMDVAFTFSTQGTNGQLFLYSFLKDQMVWQSLMFWNVAFEEARKEEALLHRPAAGEVKKESPSITILRSYLSRMQMFELKRCVCLDFLQKQSAALNLSSDDNAALRSAVEHAEQKRSQRKS